MEKFDAENKNPIYKELANFNVLVDNENEEEFYKEKLASYEENLPEEPKNV